MRTTPQLSPRNLPWQARVMRWHRVLAWVAGIMLVLWCASGLIHTYLSLFGPQQQVFQAPQRPLQLQGMKPIPDILRQAGIDEVRVVRVVVGEDENLLQVTQEAQQPRRYFRQGALITLMNPKAIVFYMAFFPMFVDPARHQGAITFGVMAATVAAITFIYSVIVVTLTTVLAERLRASPAVVKWLEKTAGVFLIGFGLKLAAN